MEIKFKFNMKKNKIKVLKVGRPVKSPTSTIAIRLDADCKTKLKNKYGKGCIPSCNQILRIFIENAINNNLI